MSVRVTIHPIGSNVLLTDVEAAKKNEWNRRRKVRLKQVQQQSKDAASCVRRSVNTEKENRQKAEEKLHDALLKEWQLKKIESLERQYKQCLEEVKLAQQKALEEKEMEVLMKERKERLAKLAEERGKKAMDTVRKETQNQVLEKTKAEKAKHFKKTVEDLRSSLVSTLPHPKKISRSSPKKRFEKAITRKSSSNKENEGAQVDSRYTFVPSSECKETKQPSPMKKRRIIPGQRDSKAASISSSRTWPLTTTSLAKKGKGSPPKKFRRIIHSYGRECSNEVPSSNFNLAQDKCQQVSNVAKNLRDSIKNVQPTTGINNEFSRLVENLSLLAEEEKCLRSQLLSQVRQCLHPEEEQSEAANRSPAAPDNAMQSVNEILDQTLTQPECKASPCIVTGSRTPRNAVRNKKDSIPSKSGHVKKDRSFSRKRDGDETFCDVCRKYLKHSCTEHSTTVTESVSNSSSLTYMSVSKSTIESNNSSSTTVEGVKVVVSVQGQKNLVKSVKIGKPIHLKKKKRARRSEKLPRSVKQLTPDSCSGSVTSYLSPPDRVPTETNEILKQILRELTKSRNGVDLNRSVKTYLSKAHDKQVESPYSETSRDSITEFDKRYSPLFQSEPSMKHVSVFEESEGISDKDRTSPRDCKKVDKTCQTLTICDKVVQTSQSLGTALNKTLQSEPVEIGNVSLHSIEKNTVSQSQPDSANIAETERLINYYCNVADKYTDCMNHIIEVLNRSANLTQESMNSSSTSHRSPPRTMHDSVHLSESMKQLVLSTKQSKQPAEPSKTPSPEKSQSPKDSSFLRKETNLVQKSPKRDRILQSMPESPVKSLDEFQISQHRSKFLYNSLFDEQGNLVSRKAVQEMLESTGSLTDKDRPFMNYTLDISSLTSEEENGSGRLSDLVHTSLDSPEKSLFRNQQAFSTPIQQSKFNTNRIIAGTQDLSTILEVDTPSTTHQTASHIHEASILKKRLQKSSESMAREIIQKNQDLLQSRIDSLQQQIEILNQSQKSRSADTSQELQLSLNESHKKKSEKSPTTKRKSASDESPNGQNTSTESELPDIVDELIKRGLISSPFPWMKELKDKFGNGKDNPPASKKHTTSSESESTQLINEELENILRNDQQPTDLEDVFKNLGSSWAVSTWKKIAETSRFNSLSSSDSSQGKKPDPSESRSYAPKHSTPIKHGKKHHSSRVSTSPSQSNDISPEVIFPQDLNCGISSVNNSASDVYDLTPPDVALHRPQLLRKDDD